jgi:hypothetical protein
LLPPFLHIEVGPELISDVKLAYSKTSLPPRSRGGSAEAVFELKVNKV